MRAPVFFMTPEIVQSLMAMEVVAEDARRHFSHSSRIKISDHLAAEHVYHAVMLEGSHLVLSDVEAVLAQKTIDASVDPAMARHVRGYAKARQLAEEFGAEKRALTHADIQNFYGAIKTGGEVECCVPYRGRASSLADHFARRGDYLPPSGAMVESLMEELFAWLQSAENVPAIVRAAVVFHRVMAIEPFASDTLLVAAVSAHAIIASGGYSFSGAAGVESYYLQDWKFFAEHFGARPRKSFYAARLREDISTWVDYVVDMFACSLRRVVAEAQQSVLEQQAAARVQKTADKLISADKPIISAAISELLSSSSIPAPSAPVIPVASSSVAVSPVLVSSASRRVGPRNPAQLTKNIARVAHSPTLASLPIKEAESETTAVAVAAKKAEKSVVVDERQKRFLKAFEGKEVISAKQIRSLFRVKPRTASGLCKQWMEQGFLEVVDPSNKARSYRLGKKYRVISSRAAEPKVQAPAAAQTKLASKRAANSAKSKVRTARR